MRVKLKVMKGASAGKTFEVKLPQFVIGRSSGCQLRPQSDAISRQHCVILLHEDGVSIRDLGSRNGTVVNGATIVGETRLATGDQLRVGPLHLEVTVTDDAGVVRPAAPAAEVAAKRVDKASRPAPSKATGPVKPSDSGLISDWLLAEDDAEKESTGLSQVATRQFKLDETERIELEKAAEEVEEATPDGKNSGKKKKEPGKLPPRAEDQTANSQEAAEKTLRKMFQRGL